MTDDTPNSPIWPHYPDARQPAQNVPGPRAPEPVSHTSGEPVIPSRDFWSTIREIVRIDNLERHPGADLLRAGLLDDLRIHYQMMLARAMTAEGWELEALRLEYRAARPLMRRHGLL